MSYLIEFEELPKNTLILRGFDPYSPLYSLIRNYFSKLVSVEYILTSICVLSMTMQIHLVSALNGLKLVTKNHHPIHC